MRILGKLLLWIVCIFLGFVALIPTFLSVNATRNVFLTCVSYVTEYTVWVGSANVGWITPLEASDITIIDKKGNERFSCKKFKSDRTLLQLIANPKDYGLAVVSSPKIVVVPEATTAPTLRKETPVKHGHKAKKRTSKKKPVAKVEKTAYILPTVDISVENGDIEFIPMSEATPLTIKNLNFRCVLSPDQAKLKLEVDLLDSHIAIDCSADQPALLSELLDVLTKQQATKSRIQWDITASSINLTALQSLPIPAMASELALAQSLFGGTLSLSTKGIFSSDDLQCNTSITSPNIQSHFSISKEGPNLRVDGTKLLQTTITPATYSILSKYLDLPNRITLVQNGQIELSISPTTIPLPLTDKYPENFSFTLRTVNPIPFAIPNYNYPLMVQHFTTGTNKGNAFTFASNTGLMLGSKTSQAKIVANGTTDKIDANLTVTGSWSDILMPIRKDLAELLGPNFALTANVNGPYNQLSGTGKVSIVPVDADLTFSTSPKQLQCRIIRATNVESRFLPLTAEVDISSDNSGNLIVNSPFVSLSAKNVVVDTTKSTLQFSEPATIDLKVPKTAKLNPFTINCTLEPASINWENQTGDLSFDLNSSEISGDTFQPTVIKGHGALNLDKKDAAVSFQIHHQLQAKDILNVTFNAQLPENELNYNTQIELNEFPIKEFSSHFLPKEAHALLGDTLSGKIDNWFYGAYN